MPVNRRYPLAALLDAAMEYTRLTGRRITFEYILIRGINDSPGHARMLAAVARRIPSKVNLIALNTFAGCNFERPSDETVESFQRILVDRNVTALIRKSKGGEILAACGQLASG